jgi:hypothetical protein
LEEGNQAIGEEEQETREEGDDEVMVRIPEKKGVRIDLVGIIAVVAAVAGPNFVTETVVVAVAAAVPVVDHE